MPYKKMREVPGQFKTHKGVKLTLKQINYYIHIADGIIANNPRLPRGIAYATAWKIFEKKYKLNKDKTAWVERSKK